MSSARLSTADAAFDDPLARTASLTYYWRDSNGDATVQRGELDLRNGRLAASGLDPDQPAASQGPDRIPPGLRAPRTRELALSVQRRMGGVSASLRGSWRRRTDALWTPLAGLTLADYEIRGSVRDTLFGTEYDVGYYAPASESKIVPGNGRVLENRRGYRQDAVVVDAAAEGGGPRLGWKAFAAWMDWRERFTDRRLAVQDPTSTEGEPLADAGPLAVRPGGLGRSDLFVNARWQAGLLARASLPFRFRTGVRLHAREGFPIPYFQTANTGDPTAGSKNVLVSPTLDSYRLPAVVLLDMRLERAFRVGRGRLTAAADVFNLLNRGTPVQAARDVELSAPGRAREILRPRLVQLGLDYSF